MDAYAARLVDDARQAGVELGAARFDDDENHHGDEPFDQDANSDTYR